MLGRFAVGRASGTNLGRALADDLRDLAVDLSAGGYTHSTLDLLDLDLRHSVRSALGTTIALQVGGGSDHAAQVNLVARTLDPDEILAACAVPLARLGPRLVGTVTFYAAEPQAFAHVAADLAEALMIDPADLDQHAVLPESPLEPAITGLQDFSLVNRALGVLINRGYRLEAARTELEDRAGQAHVDLVTAALAVLRSAYY